ncbi:4-oxalocrotonate tautomerase [Streptomyces sp. ADI92-24]|uniref:tautomerase family protein n=1 Tax=Streptomyces sp. ADI92-24 TaxID=1522756 RepID=UPI000F956829|nr:tautomerase family protein [Streptomyces sp. ADI92-24]RPK41660.1 4-oxalocrotonate tautomerase [Streptomyces sp. ADI92-24]
MPFVEIYLRKGKSPEFHKAVSEAVHESMREVFQIPEDDFFHVVHDMEPSDILQAPTFFGVERSADSVIIRMTFNHRPPAQKTALFEAIADRLVATTGMRREDVLLTVLETAAENWWAQGRSIDPETGFDTRMSPEAVRAGRVG